MPVRKIGCNKCGKLVAFEASEAQKRCPECGALVKDVVACLACGFVGRSKDFKGNQCPKCGWEGLARSEDEAQMIANNLRKLTGKVGWFCPSCNVIACSTCSHRAAAAAGKGYFVCPTCGANISENYAK